MEKKIGQEDRRKCPAGHVLFSSATRSTHLIIKKETIKSKSDLYAKITTADTEVKSKAEVIFSKNKRVVTWSYDMKGQAQTKCGTFFFFFS